MAAVAIQLIPNDDEVVLRGARFPVELRHPGFDPDAPETWPSLAGRIEYVDGRLLYMPPCADTQQYVAVDAAHLLRRWSEEHPQFLVGGNEAGMKLGGDIRGADVAVWRRADAGAPKGRFQQIPPVLAVEIAGEDEDESDLRVKAQWYLDHGARLVWLVLPATREILVITSGEERRYHSGDQLAETELLPGLAPDVSRFFSQLP